MQRPTSVLSNHSLRHLRSGSQKQRHGPSAPAASDCTVNVVLLWCPHSKERPWPTWSMSTKRVATSPRGLREPLKPRRSCFRSLGVFLKGDKSTELGPINRGNQEAAFSLKSKPIFKNQSRQTSCLQAESSPQMGFVWTAVGLQCYS